MVAKLHATLKRFYPMRNICNILEGHFAKLDQLDHKVSSNNMNGAALHDIATNDAALLQGVTFLAQQFQQQQTIYQELDHKRERDYAINRRTASLVDSLNAHLTVWAAQNQQRGNQLTDALEQLAKAYREPLDRGLKLLATVEALGQRFNQLESRTLQELDCFQKLSAELGNMIRETDSRRADEVAQILEKVSGLPTQQAGAPPAPADSDDQGALGSQSTAITMKGGHFDLENPDVSLLMHLARLLPNRTALDIGANTGAVSGRLLSAGYEVIAFEPFPPVFTQLQGSFGDDEHFHAHQLALGYDDRTMDLHLAEDVSPTPKYGDSISLYHSLMPHSMPSDLQFARTINVRVRSLDSLVRANLVPSEVGLIKIDTEGNDLQVIRGMGACSSRVLMAEFWDSQMVFGRSGAMNRLSDLVGEVRSHGYLWHIIIYRSNNKPISYYCNQDRSVAESWGNVMCFKDKEIFEEARQWCSSVMPPTYFIG
jgi:FkbM family methyltransferase